MAELSAKSLSGNYDLFWKIPSYNVMYAYNVVALPLDMKPHNPFAKPLHVPIASFRGIGVDDHRITRSLESRGEEVTSKS